MTSDTSPFRQGAVLVWHFAGMFQHALLPIAVISMFVEGINLFLILSLSDIVDGVSTQGAATFLVEDWSLLALMAVLLFPVSPFLSLLSSTLSSQAVAVCLPSAIQWQGHKAVERPDIAFFHDLFAGQVASRLSQVATAVQQQVVVAFYSIPNFTVHFLGSLFLLVTVGWELMLSAPVWIVASVVIAILAVPHFSERSKLCARQRSLVVGAMTDLYADMAKVKHFAAEYSEAGA